MPTVNPRINVTLSPSLFALVGRMAKVQRASRSQVLRELLEAAEPALQRAATMMESASLAAENMKDEVRRSLDVAQTRAEQDLERAMGTLDQVTDDLVSMAEAVRARRPARRGARYAQRAAPEAVGAVETVRPGVGDPPSSKRGVKSSRKLSGGGRS